MTLSVRFLFVALIASQLLACGGLTGLSTRTPGTGASAPEAVVVPPLAEDETGLSGDLLFDILLGEVAGQREQLEVSVEHYLRAAEVSDDPRLAERALRIALFAKQEDAALTAARRWVELAPENLEARQSLGVLALHAQVADEAYEQFEYLLSVTKDETHAFQGLTGLLARSEDKELALAMMARLVEQHPQSAQAHLAYSRLALLADKLDLALQEVGRALELQPGAVEALILRAGVRVKAGQPEIAEKELRNALAAQPQDVELRLALARLLLDLHDLPGAAEQFEQVVKLQPDHTDALYSLGLLAMEQRQLKSAESYFRKLIDTGKREQEARFYLGRVLELRGRQQDAMDQYGLVNEGEYWLEAQTRAASVRAQLGDLEGARRQLEGLRLREPSLAVRLYLVEGEILAQAGELQEAMALYDRVLAESPDNHDVLYARALVAEKLNDLPATESDLRRIIEQDPDNFHAWNALGYTLADRTDRLEEALGYIEKALTLSPEEAAIV
ncbi:MAG: tetratricopeptide repeat protein, partial [Thiohalobacteraceae bacterium]